MVLIEIFTRQEPYESLGLSMVQIAIGNGVTVRGREGERERGVLLHAHSLIHKCPTGIAQGDMRPQIPTEISAEMQQLMESMLQYNPEERLDSRQVIDRLETISAVY